MIQLDNNPNEETQEVIAVAVETTQQSLATQTGDPKQEGEDLATVAASILSKEIFQEDKDGTLGKILVDSIKKNEQIYKLIEQSLEKLDISTLEGQMIAGGLFTNLLEKALKANEGNVKIVDTVTKLIPKQQKTAVAVGTSLKTQDIFSGAGYFSDKQFNTILDEFDKSGNNPIEQRRKNIQKQLEVVVDSEYDKDEDEDDEESIKLAYSLKEEDEEDNSPIIYSPSSLDESI